MISTNKKYLRSGICLLLSAIILAWTVPVLAIDLFGTKKHRTELEAFELLPDDLRNRWVTLTSQADTSRIGEYIIEGQLILEQIQKLVDVVGGEPPIPGDPSYPVYAGVLDDLVRLLDMIEMAAVRNMDDDEQLQNLLNEYRTEKEQLEKDIRTDRQNLIAEGSERLKQQLRDPEYRKHPHRRTVVADLYFRIAELMYQEALAKRDDEGATWVQLLETDPAAAMAMGEPKMDVGPVLTMYQHIIDEFADTQYGVDALYNIAVLLAMSEYPNDRATSNQYLETLITLYPGNRYTLNALRRIGEYYFYPPINDLEKSISIFTRIKDNYPDTPEHIEALYKLGWAYYRIGDFGAAVEHFAQTLDADYGPNGEKIEKKALKDFSPDAIRYLGICYTVRLEDFPEGGIDGLVTWFENHPDRLRNYGTDAVLTLGNIFYEDRQMYREGVQAYDKFLELFPLEPRAPKTHEKIVEIFLNENIFDPQRKLDEPRIFFDTYNPDSEWWATNTDENNRKRIIPLLEKYLDLHINDLLVLGVGADMRQTNVEYLEKFESYVRQYLRFWPKGPNAYTNHSNMAYILSKKLDRPMDGMKEYWQVATSYPDNKEDMEIACETVVGIAIGFAQQEKAGQIYVTDEGFILPAEAAPIDTTAEVAVAAEERDPLSLEPDINRTELLNSERMELSAFDLYTENFPNGKLIEIILYTAGSFLYEHDWIAEARPYLEKYITDFPKGEYFKDSYKFLFDGYFKTVDLKGVEDVCARIQSEDLPKELKDYAIERKAVGILRNALGLQNSEDHIAAADEFVRLALEVPKYDKSANSLFLAGSEYTAGGAFEKANEAYLMLVERYPNFEQADDALWNVALNQRDQLEQFAEAAKTFERMVDEYPNSERVHDALSNASINYGEVKDHANVIKINERFLRLFPDDPEADIYLYELAEHYLAMDDFESANSIYLRFAQKYPDDPRTIKAYYSRAVYYLEHDKIALAKQEFQSTVDAHDRQVAAEMSGEPNYAAKSLSKLLAWEHEEYDKLRFKLPKGSLDAAKERKREWRNSLIESYNKLISFGRKEGWQAFYAKGRLLDEEALATYQQEIPNIAKQDSAIAYLELVVSEAILLNDVAIFQFESGYGRLDTIGTQLATQKKEMTVDIERLKNWLAQAQLDTAIEGVQDSTKKLDLFRKALAELDSSIIESANWKEVCRQAIPEIAVRSGDYLYRSWIAKFNWENPEKATDIRMIYQEEILKNIIVPGAPEVCGLYLQAINTVQKTAINTDYWIGELNKRFTHVIDTLLSLWDNQFATPLSLINKLDQDYKTMLAKDNEFAESKDGFFLDMMGEQMLIWADYFNEYNKDKLIAFSAVLDTVIQYERPIGFGDEALSKPLQGVLQNYDVFCQLTDLAVERKTEYKTEYEEKPYYYDEYYEEDVERYWYSDAAVAYEDIEATMNDYSEELLVNGLSIKDKYSLPGLAGISILRKLVELKPDVYLERVGIEPQHFTIVSNPEDWLIWPLYETGFETIDFDDSGWQHPHPSMYPSNVSLGMLDSLRAVPIWYNLDEPPALPEWTEYPDEVFGKEGEIIEFTVVGIAPERKEPEAEAEYEEELPVESEEFPGPGEEIAEPDTTLMDTTFVEIEQPAIEEPEQLLSDLSVEFRSNDIPIDEVAFTDNGDGSATFTWVPSFTASGEYTATFILYNFNIPMPLSIPVIVENVDRGFTWVGYPEQYTTDEGMTAKFTVSGEDPDGDSLTIVFNSEDIPDIAEFIDNGDGSGEFSWETTYEDSGSYTATFTMSDGINTLDLELPIVINNAIRSPKWIEFPDSVKSFEGDTLSIEVVGSSPDGLPLTLTDNSLDFPEAAVFSDNGDGKGVFNWIPDFESSGNYLLSLEMTDGDTIIALEIPVIINEFTRSPHWVDLPGQIAVDEGNLLEFTVVGEHPDGLALTLEYFSIDIPDTAAIFIDNGDGTGSYNWQTFRGDEGSYTASFILSDQDTSIISDVQIAVGGVALPPSWTNYPQTNVNGNAGSVVEFMVGGYDPTGLPMTIIYSSDNLPETAQFTYHDDGTGTFSWQTIIEDIGTYSAKFDLSNDESSAKQLEITIVISSVSPPEWVSYPETEIAVNAGEIVEFGLSATDPAGLPLTIEYSSESLPETVQFTDYADGTGSFNWQTTADDAGSFTATFNLSNGEASASPVTVAIIVIGAVEPPVWVSYPETEITVNAGEVVEFGLSATDPAGLPLTIEYSSENLPETVQFTDYADGTGSFNWQTTADDAGSFTATFNLSNGEASASPVTVATIVIGAV
ncbi:tetratricopeptide repeat protein, partial [bacterium]|nr:tetratricopeptide repeat protein [bacterium]